MQCEVREERQKKKRYQLEAREEVIGEAAGADRFNYNGGSVSCERGRRFCLPPRPEKEELNVGSSPAHYTDKSYLAAH